MRSLKMSDKMHLNDNSAVSSTLLPVRIIIDFIEKLLKNAILKVTSGTSFALQDLFYICSGVGNNYGWGLSEETMKTAILPVNLVFLCFSILSKKCFTLFYTLKQNWCFFFSPEVSSWSLPPSPPQIVFQSTLQWCQLLLLNRFIFFLCYERMKLAEHL